MGEAASEEELVQTVVSFHEVFTYRVPPLTSNAAGYRAEQWNLEAPFSTGPMAVFSKGEVILIKISSPGRGLIAQVTIQLDLDRLSSPEAKLDYWVEQTKDSSRYFVLRMVDQKTKKKALLGVGFRERAAAFEFQEALIHHFNRVKRWRGIKEKPEAGELGAEEDGAEGGEMLAPPDSGLDAEDVVSSTAGTKSATPLSALSGPIKLNIPGNRKAATPVAAAAAKDDEDEDWGDFQS
ncbi:hypothetical protein BASA81_002475 [Batrachochytrium salamandrivorans]|nr:hypothetical protein BASA81_002475 [Batrachochytrium salamandrivorans]